jgi:thioredoxin-like negative regulator of GroEL
MERAARALRHGDLDAAVPFLERTLAVTRDRRVRVEAHLTLGRVLGERDEPGRATSHLRTAADLASRRADVLYELGLAQARQENNRVASETLRRAADLDPDDAEIARALGVALASIGQDLEADRQLERAARLAPDDALVLESLAAHHLKMGRFARCGAVVARASELAPENRALDRLSREAAYLLELAATPGEGADADPRRRLRVALPGVAGEVERRFAASMARAGFTEAQRLNGREIWRDYLRRRRSRPREAAMHAAAVEFLVARLDFVEGCSRDAVAARHGIAEAALSRAYEDLVEVLDVAVFDQRYSTRPSPVEQVGDGAAERGLAAEEVLRALLEDEYRQYEEEHQRQGCVEPRLGREEFEDASVEYGCVLTREMMGVTLGRSERRRKRELERLLLVKQ